MQIINQFIHYSAVALEITGIAIIVIISISAIFNAFVMLMKGVEHHTLFRAFRHHLARGILLGLEFLVGADIINTVTLDMSFRSIGVLAVVVLIRTFLSFTLETEMSGHWPWQEHMVRAGKAKN